MHGSNKYFANKTNFIMHLIFNYNCDTYLLGVAQTHSSLLMMERQRMPGLNNGQVYTYPSKRWKKKRRQYLLNTCNSSSVNSSVFNSGRRKESG